MHFQLKPNNCKWIEFFVVDIFYTEETLFPSVKFNCPSCIRIELYATIAAVKCIGSFTELSHRMSLIKALTAMHVAYLCEKANISTNVAIKASIISGICTYTQFPFHFSLFSLDFDPKSHNCPLEVHQSRAYVHHWEPPGSGDEGDVTQKSHLSPIVTCTGSFMELGHHKSPIQALNMLFLAYNSV